ncbi:IS630 family transposase [Deinococcus altitudinis]|uniref:IS630 family transposase n=1 Tax=Deinococcus altitudinis TaxID=468914 RepID=UPI0038914FA4
MPAHLQLSLSSQDRLELTELTTKGTAKVRTITRAQILLLADRSHGERRTQTAIAQTLGCSASRVNAIMKRYLEHGLQDALYERPRLGTPPKIDGVTEAHLMVLACSTPPEGRKRWTVRLLADHMVELGHMDYVGRMTIQRSLKQNQIKPWQVKSWCLPKPSAKFVAKMEDVLDVYARPYDPRFPVVCLDEASKELRSTPRGGIPPTPGACAREDYEYARNGTANIFLAVEPLAGKRSVRVTDRRTNIDFAQELRRLVEVEYRYAEKVVLVTDNLSIHSVNALYEAFEPEVARRSARRIEWHYTPEHASWLNVAEIELSALSTQCLGRRIESKDALERQTAAWELSRNRQKSRIIWHFRTDDARIKLRRLYPTFQKL